MTIEVEPEVKGSEEKHEKFDVANNNNKINDKNNKNKKNNKNNKNNYGRNYKRNENRSVKKAQVKCQIPELKDKVFDCTGYRQAEEYKKSKEALESYLTSQCKHGTDIRQTLEKMVKFKVPAPIIKEDEQKDTDPQKAMNKRINEKRVDAYVQRENALEENIALAYNIAWDMCTDEMQAKLKAVTDFQGKICDPMDVIALLEAIRKIIYNFQDKRYVQHNMLMTWKKFYDLKQQPHESVQEHYERFKLQVKVVESVGGSFGRDDQLLLDAGFTGGTLTGFDEMRKAAEIAKQKFLAYKFIYDADHARYGHVKEGLHSDYNKDYEKKGKKYPETIDAAYNLLLASKAKRVPQATSNVTFAQTSKKNDKKIPEWKMKIQCYKCKKFGHFANECVFIKGKGNEVNCCNISVVLTVCDKFMAELKFWILLDNQSTTDIFCNKNL